MKKRLKISKGDRDEIIIEHPQKTGEPRRIDIYFITRAGISWATANSPFYYCILGSKNEPTLTDKWPLVLLAEGETETMELFFERLTRYVKKLFCEWTVADFKNNFENSLLKFVRAAKIEGIRRYDSSEFMEGDLEHSIALIRQWRRDNALVIPKDTILGKQIRSMTPEDLKDKPDERYYAVMALCRVLGSFEDRPWQKPTGGFVGFSNFADRNRSDTGWRSGYKEVYI